MKGTVGLALALVVLVVSCGAAAPVEMMGPADETVYSLGGYVFLDWNEDGLRNPGETVGLSDQRVTIIGDGRTEVSVTAADGWYQSFGFLPGAYTVTYLPKAGYGLSSPGALLVELGEGLPGLAHFGVVPKSTPPPTATPTAIPTSTPSPSPTETSPPTATPTASPTPGPHPIVVTPVPGELCVMLCVIDTEECVKVCLHTVASVFYDLEED